MTPSQLLDILKKVGVVEKCLPPLYFSLTKPSKCGHRHDYVHNFAPQNVIQNAEVGGGVPWRLASKLPKMPSTTDGLKGESET